MKILYISKVVDTDLLHKLHETSMIKPQYSIQKFHRLILEGFIYNGLNVSVISGIPVSNKSHSKKIWNVRSKLQNKIRFTYIPFINVPVIRHLCLFLGCFFKVLFTSLKEDKQTIIVLDILDVSISFGVLLASKIRKIKTCGIVTDHPLFQFGRSESMKVRMFRKFVMRYISSFSSYVVMTEWLNIEINQHNKPYVIMEGLVDLKEYENGEQYLERNKNKVILYSGGLYYKYGINHLINGFLKLDRSDVILELYGNGDMVDEIIDKSRTDSRIKYYGVVTNDEIIRKQKEATLLINPRPTIEQLTYYSFPSKNMEYMVSGTPVVTTKLAGMPKEYYQYVYLIENENAQGIYELLVHAIEDPDLKEKGKQAKEYVLNYKNNKIQCAKIIEMLESFQNNKLN